jgi:TolB-like protein/Tfp pilus assembly protein PilF
MGSLIPGYEYDIFISYRQKDNKGDRWVSEFVDALRTELDSTFKEDVSVYFDINPHDGLLETHDVDASLKDKLKCLVFIPIISRTYCDPKSFAWEHEFKAFRDLASTDQFGLKIKLPNGNVANRILPVQIHDLYPEDKATIEKDLGGIIRAIEFIYKEPGINKPLTFDDDEKKNLNNTKYRLQVNKVANAIEEVIHGLRSIQAEPVRNLQYGQQTTTSKEVGEIKEQKGRLVSNKNLKKWLVSGLLVILCISVVFGILKVIEKSKQASDIAKLEKSIAVLPFVNDSPDEGNAYFINGIMDEILNNLQKIKVFRVLSRTSVEQYRGSTKPSLPKIAKELNVNYIVEGSGQKYGNKIVLRVQLIAADNEKHLWGKSYEQEIYETNDIINIQSQIAQAIATELKAVMTPEEKQLIEKTPTLNLTAYDFYMRGREEHTKYWVNNSNRAVLQIAEDLYHKALKYDSAFAQAYTGLARVYWDKHFFAKEYFSENYMDSVLILSDFALTFDNNLAEAYAIRGDYYTYKGFINKAIEEYDKSIKLNPNSWEAYYGKGEMYGTGDLANMINNYQKAASLNHGVELPGLLRNISYAYDNAGFKDKARYYNLEAFKLDGDSVPYLDMLAEFEDSNEKAIEFERKAYAIDSTSLITVNSLAYYYMDLKQFKESLKYYKKYVEMLKANSTLTNNQMHRIGYAYWVNGYKKEAENYFDKQLEYCKNDIELKRPWGQKLYPYYDMAAIYAFRGDKEKAYENLKIFNQRQGMPLWAVIFIKTDQLFNSIRNEPEFQQIVKDVEAKYQAEHERVRKWLEEQEKL